MPRSLHTLLLSLLLLAGCSSYPSYAGGPEAEDPHGILNPQGDLTVWGVDGKRTHTRSFRIYVAPGRRNIRVRIEHPIKSDAAKPFEFQNVTLDIEAGVIYHLTRKESELPPYEVEVKEERPQR